MNRRVLSILNILVIGLSCASAWQLYSVGLSSESVAATDMVFEFTLYIFTFIVGLFSAMKKHWMGWFTTIISLALPAYVLLAMGDSRAPDMDCASLGDAHYVGECLDNRRE
ncbi:hypothetical protein [Photobacterium indicum]|uniref:hypothetical protein n=1 Tax=Photobacterium indicum TaxID=81447 RepID=UPI003D132DD6